MKRILVILLTMLICFSLNAEKELKLNLEKTFAVGKNELIFPSIESVCEDDESNVYMLSYKGSKVWKFAPDGKLLLSFGKRGEGPGDFRVPYRLAFSSNGEIIVIETKTFASFFDKNGKFIKRLSFATTISNSFGLDYAGGDLFYTEKINTDLSREQVLFDFKGKFHDVSLFAKPDISIKKNGKMAYYYSKEYSIGLLYDYFNGHSAAAVSNKYEILVLDEKGKIFTKITRKTAPGKISSKEKDFLARDIKSIKHWSPDTKRLFLNRIPDTKNFFREILVSDKYIFVFLVKDDLLAPDIPVDVFEFSGNYVGRLNMKKEPIIISGKFMYFTKVDADEDLILEKYSYRLTGEK